LRLTLTWWATFSALTHFLDEYRTLSLTQATVTILVVEFDHLGATLGAALSTNLITILDIPSAATLVAGFPVTSPLAFRLLATPAFLGFGAFTALNLAVIRILRTSRLPLCLASGMTFTIALLLPCLRLRFRSALSAFRATISLLGGGSSGNQGNSQWYQS